MDQILAIPEDRTRQNVPLLCALMGVTALLMLAYVNQTAQQPQRTAQAAPAGAAALVVAEAGAARSATPRFP